MKQYWLNWLKSAGLRAVKTFAQGMLAVLGAGNVGIMEADFVQALSVGAMAAVLSMITSLAGIPECPKEDYSNGDDE